MRAGRHDASARRCATSSASSRSSATGCCSPGFVILIAFAILLGRFSWLQVVQREYYHTLAEANRISIVPIVPNRGLILDRNGEVLARQLLGLHARDHARAAWPNVERAIDELADVIDVTPRDRRRFKKLQEESKNFESLPIRTRLTEEEVARFAVNRYRFPGFEIKARLFRSYPQGEVASHAIGYIGRINDADVKRIDDAGPRRPTTRAPTTSASSASRAPTRSELHGVTGSEQVEIDAGGRAIRVARRAASRISGNNLMRDARPQAAEDRRGRLPATQAARWWRSTRRPARSSRSSRKPGFDPNLFVDGIDPQNWDALNNSPDKPLNNRALRGQYPPGSTIKPFMALAALEYRQAHARVHDLRPGLLRAAGGAPLPRLEARAATAW